MAKRQPEGRLKDQCRSAAIAEGLVFWAIGGKGVNGVPDNLCGKASGGAIFIEFKKFGERPRPQQWLRIWELRNAGIEAWWCNSVEMYRRLVRLDPGGYEVVYPESAKRIIRKQYGFDAV